MKEVKRYMAIGGMLPGEGFGDGVYVRDEDFRAAQSELAAFREELAEIKESLAYRGSLLNRIQQRAEVAEQRLADAERRNASDLELLRRIDEAWNVPDPSEEDRACWAAIDAALAQPEEVKS